MYWLYFCDANSSSRVALFRLVFSARKQRGQKVSIWACTIFEHESISLHPQILTKRLEIDWLHPHHNHNAERQCNDDSNLNIIARGGVPWPYVFYTNIGYISAEEISPLINLMWLRNNNSGINTHQTSSINLCPTITYAWVSYWHFTEQHAIHHFRQMSCNCNKETHWPCFTLFG